MWMTIMGIAAQNSWWILKQFYNIGSWLVYGTPESVEEQLNKRMAEMEKNVNEIKDIEKKRLQLQEYEQIRNYRNEVKKYNDLRRENTDPMAQSCMW
jgi:hypothetical protein